MLCSRARTALSARLDGEDLPPGVPERRLREHLAGCADCRAWEAGALGLRRLVGDAVADAGDAAGEPTKPRPAGEGADDPGPASGSSGRHAC